MTVCLKIPICVKQVINRGRISNSPITQILVVKYEEKKVETIKILQKTVHKIKFSIKLPDTTVKGFSAVGNSCKKLQITHKRGYSYNASSSELMKSCSMKGWQVI